MLSSIRLFKLETFVIYRNREGWMELVEIKIQCGTLLCSFDSNPELKKIC